MQFEELIRRSKQTVSIIKPIAPQPPKPTISQSIPQELEIKALQRKINSKETRIHRYER